jgi:hypothetical protein
MKTGCVNAILTTFFFLISENKQMIPNLQWFLLDTFQIKKNTNKIAANIQQTVRQVHVIFFP